MSELKRVAIMQPYIFPYLGYFQLAASCDIFVLYDNANYIKQGFCKQELYSQCRSDSAFCYSCPGSLFIQTYKGT